MDQLSATVLRTMLTKPGWSAYSNVVSPDIFMDNMVRTLYGHMQNLHTTIPGDIDIADLRLDVEASYPLGESRSDELLEAIAHVKATPKTNPQATKEAVCKYSTRQRLVKAAKYIASHLGDSSLDPYVVLEQVQRAAEVYEESNVGLDSILNASLPCAANDRPNICSLGLAPELDRLLGGGVASGELIVFLAPPKRGKTSVLCAIGASAAAQGKGVLDITLEISKPRVIRRYEGAWTKLKYDEMIMAPTAVTAARKKILAAGGDVFVEDWSHVRDKTPNDIKAVVNRLRSAGKKVDMLIVDYLALLQPNGTKTMARREMRHVYGQLGMDMRAISSALKMPIITAWQINRAGNSIDTPTQEHVAESWDIIMHADALISMGQSEAEKRNKIMRMVLLEHRFGDERGVVHLHSDMGRMDIKPLER